MTRTVKMLLCCIGAGLFMAGVIWAAGEERFFGGGFDGYGATSQAGMKIRDAMPSGTMLSIR